MSDAAKSGNAATGKGPKVTDDKLTDDKVADAVRSIRIAKTESIDAPPEVVWEAILEEVGSKTSDMGNRPLRLTLEPTVGGRWYRDLGDGVGHLWGHVQVIKPPKLLELSGPMFMSYAATNHVQYRLTPEGDKTRLDLLHTAVGLIPAEDAKGVEGGWSEILGNIRKSAEAKRATR